MHIGLGVWRGIDEDLQKRQAPLPAGKASVEQGNRRYFWGCDRLAVCVCKCIFIVVVAASNRRGGDLVSGRNLQP